jgi:hypothetical protein
VLNERQFQTEKIPLLTAIATSNPTADDYYNEPLDPANLTASRSRSAPPA